MNLHRMDDSCNTKDGVSHAASSGMAGEGRAFNARPHILILVLISSGRDRGARILALAVNLNGEKLCVTTPATVLDIGAGCRYHRDQAWRLLMRLNPSAQRGARCSSVARPSWSANGKRVLVEVEEQDAIIDLPPGVEMRFHCGGQKKTAEIVALASDCA